jgi:hypothetical protein
VQDFTADVSTIVSFAALWSPASGSSTCVIKTNSSGSPADTITLLAGKALLWDTQVLATIGTACPLTVDVTGLFITTTAIGDLTALLPDQRQLSAGRVAQQPRRVRGRE